MNFQLKHRGIDVPDSLKVAIAQKIERFERLLPESAYVEIELSDHSSESGAKVSEVIVDIPGQKQIIRFMAHEVTYLAAVDAVLYKLDDRVSQWRHKNSDHHYKGKSPKEWLADSVNTHDL